MRRLLLLRHAKSDWSTALPDRDRQLSARGRNAAARMGRYIDDEDLIPDLVLYSPATRAAETWSLVRGALSRQPETRTCEELYDFGGGTALLDVIRQHGGSAHSLMLIGHNPSMEGLAGLLMVPSGSAREAAMARKYPTAALAEIHFDQDDWSSIAPATGRLVRFVRPKQLD